MNVVEEIQKLKALLDSGALTEDEFISAKAALLSKQGATPDAKIGRSSPSKAPALALVGVLVTGAGGTGIFFYQQEQARVAEVARLKAEHDARELSAREEVERQAAKELAAREEIERQAAAEKARIEAEQRAVIEAIQAKERLRERLKSDPYEFISGGAFDTYDKGFVNTYTRVTAITFTNSSEFDVTSIKGKITLTGHGGRELATVPFTAEGELHAGETRKLAVSSTDISGGTTSGMTRVESVRVR